MGYAQQGIEKSRKYITELIALVNNCGHSVILITHSPYVLGTLNNLGIDSSEYTKYKMRWGDKLIQKTGWLEENI
ncbi:MAG TPA: hypothetical protein DCR27_09385 [Lachnospiraceae bacterium]|nr:hypothetical protein [Lachnospiraceae bacterium]